MPVPLDPFEIPDLLANLVDRSLVVCDPVTGRHHLSESMRVYAQEQLGEEEDRAKRKLLDYYLAVGQQLREFSRRFEIAKAVAMFEPEIDNFRVAYEWSLRHDPAASLRLIACAGSPWHRGRRLEAEQAYINALKAAPPIADEDHVLARIDLCRCLLRGGKYQEAEEQMKIARKELDSIPDREPLLEVELLMMTAVCYTFSGKTDRALEYLQTSVELARKHGFVHFQMAGHINLGETRREAGEFEVAIEHYKEALSLSHNDPFEDALILFNLGSAYVETGDLESAEDSFRKALASQDIVGQLHTNNGPIGGLGFIFIERGLYRDAGLVMGYTEGRRQRVGAKMDPVDGALFGRYRALGSQLGGAEFEQAFAEGANLTVEQLRAVIGPLGGTE